MKLVKYLFYFSFIYWTTISSFAQTAINHSFWAKTNFFYIHKKQSYGIELAYRQEENDVERNKNNPFVQPFLRGARTWVYFGLNPKWRIEYSPLAWFVFHPIIGNPQDLKKNIQHDIRTALYGSYKISFNKFEWINRMGWEARFIFDKYFSTQTTQLYTREKMTLQYQANKTWILGVFDELMFPFQNSAGIFAQAHLLHKKLVVETGTFYWQRAIAPKQNIAYTLTLQYKYVHK